MQCRSPFLHHRTKSNHNIVQIINNIFTPLLLTPVTPPSWHGICLSSPLAAVWCQDTAPGRPPHRYTPSDSTFSAQSWQGWRPASSLEPQLVTFRCQQEREGSQCSHIYVVIIIENLKLFSWLAQAPSWLLKGSHFLIDWSL